MRCFTCSVDFPRKRCPTISCILDLLGAACDRHIMACRSSVLEVRDTPLSYVRFILETNNITADPSNIPRTGCRAL